MVVNVEGHISINIVDVSTLMSCVMKKYIVSLLTVTQSPKYETDSFIASRLDVGVA